MNLCSIETRLQKLPASYCRTGKCGHRGQMLFPVEVICYNADPEKRKKRQFSISKSKAFAKWLDKLMLEFSSNNPDQATGT